ncbi:reverse transcriptase domain-containing protein [Dyella sp.]|uniref:reverse transcriptase domain-containing protein n=1 Tax=Dyella sp. TaxID=1869338 RepID=UPI00283F1FF9|nr:reverse transcriptase domain-containing protein [Dyella sp.]MDR3446587.1 reverse transcriptase domain-containing protein [Dyella sp.]
MDIDPPSQIRLPATIKQEDEDVIVLDCPPSRTSAPSALAPPSEAIPAIDAATDATDAAMLRLTRKAHFILVQGGPHAIGRSAKSLSATPLAPLTKETINKLNALHPTAREPMGDLPDSAFDVGMIDAQRLDRVLRHRVHNGSAPGVSGTTGSHLVAMWNAASPDGRLGFQLLIRDICNGVFDGELKERLLAAVLVPLSKPNGSGVRPIAIAETLVRCASFYMMSLIEDDMASFFPRIQFGVKLAGGSEAAAHLTRAELAYAGSRRDDIIALKVDFRNAFNAIHRHRVWQALCAHPKASPILKAFYWQYAESSPLLVYERGQLFQELRSSSGVRQGCPFAAFAFALTVQPLYERSLEQSPNCNGFSIQDDFTLVGPCAEVMLAYDHLAQHAHAELGLELVAAKCQVYLPPTTTAHLAATRAIHDQCAVRGLACDTKMESLGVMFGGRDDIVAHCDAAVDGSARFFECISHASMPVQTASLLLRYCAIPKLGYLARTTHPEPLTEPARRFDQMALRAQMAILHLQPESLSALTPRLADTDCRVHDPTLGAAAHASPPSASQLHLSTDRVSQVTDAQVLERIALPLSMGGLGLRRVGTIRHAAYLASLQQILPHFARLHPELHDQQAFEGTQVCHELTACREEIAHAISNPSHHDPVPHSFAPVHSRSHTGAAAAAVAASRCPSPTRASRIPASTPTVLASIDAIWSRAVAAPSAAVHSPSHKLQHALTLKIEQAVWQRLYDGSARYQQAILTSLAHNPATSVWLTTPPLSSEPGYRMRDADYRLACRHRLGLLPYDDLRDKACAACARRNIETPTLLADPDHAHACILQESTSRRQCHDAVKMVVAGLARSCGYCVEVEPHFPYAPEVTYDPAIGAVTTSFSRPNIRGDLLLIRDNTRTLVDVTITRPTTMTQLTRGAATTGAHARPLVAAAQAEQQKHQKYDAECARHQWKLVPFVLETYGAKGTEARQLLERMSAHCTDRSPSEFLAHADRLLSIALQTGNALVASQGAAGLLLREYHTATAALSSRRGPGVYQRRRVAVASRANHGHGRCSDILHAHYRSARIGVMASTLLAWGA